MRNRLHVRKIETIGLVGRGDNPAAEVVFFKSRATAKAADDDSARQVGRAVAALGEGFRGREVDNPSADLPGVTKQSPADGEATDTPEAREAALEKSEQERVMTDKLPTVMAILKALGLKGDDVRDLKGEDLAKGLDGDAPAPPPDKPADTPVDKESPAVEKSADVIALEKKLADIEKRAKDAEDRAAKMEDARENERFIAKAQQFKHIAGVVADDFGPILRKCAGALDADGFAKLEGVLKAADEAARAGKLFEEVGSGAQPSNSVEAEVQKMAEEVRKADPKLSITEARAQVWKDHPDLLNRYERERQEAVRLRGATTEE